MMTFQSIGFNEEAIEMLAEYAEGSPIYVWSMVCPRSTYRRIQSRE